ncbi:Uncharacterised protein [Salmonella enterica subsp. enterica serovar Bovismorbificans]|nr:Uncharacterised protein [Salmonella enterica subsp. enterica serovar Bovismorbificans]
MRYRDKFTQRRNCLRHTNTTADVQHGFFRLFQHLARLFRISLRESRFVINGSKPGFQLTAGQLDIFRDIHQNRARTASVGDFKSLRHDARQLCQRLHQEAVFGTGQRQP